MMIVQAKYLLCSRDRYDGEKSHYRDYSPRKDDHRRKQHRKYVDEKSPSDESSGSSFVHSGSLPQPQWREDTSKRKYRSKRPHRSKFHGTRVSGCSVVCSSLIRNIFSNLF